MVSRQVPVFGTELTPPERNVVDLVAEGLTNKEIGVKLSLSQWTVKTHLDRIFIETGAHRRTELAALVIARQIRTAPEIVSMLMAMMNDRAAPEYVYRTRSWYRQQGEISVLHELIGRIRAESTLMGNEGVSTDGQETSPPLHGMRRRYPRRSVRRAQDGLSGQPATEDEEMIEGEQDD